MKKVYLLVLFFIAVVSGVKAQTITLKGKVLDEDGKPLANATIIVSGSKAGVQSNEAGVFTTKAKPDASGKATIFVSYVNYQGKTVTSDGKSDIVVQLAKSSSDLDDVVVIGYQSVKRKDLTGTVGSVSGSVIEKTPVSNIAEALTGRIPGVQVTTVDGQPGADIVIRVRGGGSVTQSNDPLYIVDGFRVSNINDISPTDITSIDILKDAATAAIYGAAGANGVVIITTKSAKGGKTTINVNSYMQLKNFPKQLEVLSPYEFVLAQYEFARINSQTSVDNLVKIYGVYDDFDLYKYQKGTNWQETLFGSPAQSQQHSVGLTAGNEKTRIALTYTRNDDLGLLPTNSYKRDYINLKLNQEISKKIKFDFGARYTQAVTNGSGTNGLGTNVRIGDGITTRPVNGIADLIVIDDGSNADDYEQFLSNLVNPLKLSEQDYRKKTVKNYTLNGGLSWNFAKNLSYRTELTLAASTGDLRRYYGPLTGTARNEGGNLPLGEITQSRSTDFRWANTISYSIVRSKHDLKFLAGQEILSQGTGFEEYNRAKYFDAGITPEKMFATMGLGTQDLHNTLDVAPSKTASFFAQSIYQFDKKYIFNLTARYDASTRFKEGNQWGFFPAASFAWRVSSEDFMQQFKFVNDLKLRVSYGAVGNNNISTDQWRVLFTPSTVRPYGAGDVYNPYYTYANSQLPNPNIKWETTITRNIGLDFAAFNNKLTGTFDIYHNTTKDLLVQSQIPQTTGFNTQQKNIGQTSNRGIELGLNWDAIRKKDFQLSFSFNIGRNWARIDKLDGVNERPFNSNWAGTDLKTADDYKFIVGKTIGLMYGYVTDGMYTVDDFTGYDATSRSYTLKAGIPTNSLGGISLRPGVLKLKDLNGDGTITSEGDRTIIGSALPKATGGFGTNINYKGFDFSAFFNWVYGNQVYNTGRISFNMYYRTSNGNMLNTSNYENRFHYINEAGNLVTDLKELAALNPNPKIWTPFSMGAAAPWFHSWAVEDGSFLRLNNIQLGYSLPKKWVAKAYMSKVRFYVTVYNALLFTKYSGYDPEVSTNRGSGYNQLTPGLDYSAFPKSRTYTLGLNVTF